jgi:hypothetical protein
MITEQINWQTTEAQAKRMTNDQLVFAIADAKSALACAEEFDRAGMIGNTGKYSDQIHVYNTELQRRQKITKKK